MNEELRDLMKRGEQNAIKHAARQQIDRNTVLERALDALIRAANNGGWHDSDDCELEGRADTCDLCRALKAARNL